MSDKKRAGRALIAYWSSHGAIDKTGAIDVNKAAGHYSIEGRRIHKLDLVDASLHRRVDSIQAIFQ